MTSGPKARVVIGMLGLDQHEIGARVVAGVLRDAGMEVVYLGKLNTPERMAKASAEEDADLIGISAHSWEYLELVPQLLAILKAQGNPIPVVVGGAVITEADETVLLKQGVAAVFRAGASNASIVEIIRSLAARVRPAGA
jgi:methylmalonyl-CoA mutase C-terminal domain/subunit